MDNLKTQSKWYDKIWLVVLLCIFFFPVGLYGLWKNSAISKGWKIGVTIVLVFIVLAKIGEEDPSPSKAVAYSSSNSDVPEDEVVAEQGVGVGEILHTDYFDIAVNKVSLQDRVNTGNEFADLNPEQGTMYLIINASFKNTDNESRMLMDGSVWINYNGRDYEFDKSEMVMLEGWGLMLDQINPLTTKTTNLVYKIPAEIKGDAFWQPGRAGSDERIALGSLN